MPNAAAYFSIFYELGQRLRRQVWQPLHRMMEIFHVLPLTAAIILILLLARSPQLREIYLSYLEGLSDSASEHSAAGVVTAANFAAALAGFTLISAALCDAHYRLTTMRINIIFSNQSNPGSDPLSRSVQRMAAISLAFAPWLGMAAGLLNAQYYAADIYPLLQAAGMDSGRSNSMQQLLPKAGVLSIVVSTVFVALAAGVFADRYRRQAATRSAVIAAIPFAAFGLFLLLADLQVETLDGLQKSVGTLALVLAGAAYYFGYYRLSTMRSGIIYAHPLNPDTGVNRQRRRRVALFVWAAFPWLAMALYFALREWAVAGQPGSGAFFPALRDLPAASRWAIFPVAMMWTIATGLVVAALLDSFRESAALQRSIIVSIIALMIVAALAAWLGEDAVVRLYRVLGPLGSLSLALLFLFSVFTLLAALSQKSGFPALSLVIFAGVVSAVFSVSIHVTAMALMIVCAIFAVMALISRKLAVALVAGILIVPGLVTWIAKSRSEALAQSTGQAGRAPNESFKEWLRLRPDAAAYSGGSKYPVFIIAVEGGGIYAATAASLFLAGLEDSNPGFSQHVFAISGVSGGAIGATVFQALRAAGSAGASKPGNECRKESAPAYGPAGRRPLVPIVSKVMQDDHFSPVVGAIFPELLGAATGRAQILARSFRNSVNSKDGGGARNLDNCFADHWSPGGPAPALVLNTTWAETGFRVRVFAVPAAWRRQFPVLVLRQKHAVR